MANGSGHGVMVNWILPLLSGLLLLAVSGLGWYARDTRGIIHHNTERIVAAETEIVNSKDGIARIEGAMQALDTKFDQKFDALLRELRQDARSGSGHTGSD